MISILVGEQDSVLSGDSFLFFFFVKKKTHLYSIIAYAESKSKAWSLMREVCRKNKENAMWDS